MDHANDDDAALSCPICRSLPEKDKPEKMTLKLSRTPKSIGEQLFPTGPPSLAKLRAQTVALVDEDAALRAQLQELVAEEDVLKVQETVLKVDAARSEVDLRRKLREEHDKLIRMRDELAAEAVSLQAELESVKARCEKSLRDRTNKRNDFYRDVEKRAKYEARTRRLQRQIVELRAHEARLLD
ncbi:hypothetical protein GGF31_008243 [Allomyces arbusculus]|nr:hypothetical protein GGF31_008243 [Allomyces arbusculus]